MSRPVKIKIEGLNVSYYTFNQGVNSVKDFITGFKFIRPFEKKEVLHQINLEIYEGDVLGILGRNGAGKSTLLKAIAGILKPTKGSVQVNGKVAPLLAIGAGMEMELTGYENIRLIGSLMGHTMKQTKLRTENIKDFSELSHEQLSRQVKTYSTGMISRLSFSMAVADMPDILIVDEVLSVGDVGFQQKCVQRINEIQKAGGTILFVSHSLGEVERICNRGGVSGRWKGYRIRTAG